MFNIIRRHIIGYHQHVVPKEAQLCWPTTSSSLGASRIERRNVNNSAAYDGDGKTTVRVLGQDESHLNLVNTYSSGGFRLHNGLFITGSILLFPTNVFAWNVHRGKDITLDSLLIFDLIVPKTKIVIIGYGQYGEPHDSAIPIKLKKKGISCEMLATPNAVTTYNYLVHDSVHVAGAFVPVKDEVKMDSRDMEALQSRNKFMSGHFTEEHHSQRVPANYDKILYDKYVGKDADKKKFDE